MRPMNPTWRRHDWQRFIRHDAHRFLTPAGIAEEKRAAEAERAAQREADEAAVAAEHEEFERELLQVRRDLTALKFELALRRIFHKYSPDQPRVPAGSPEGGQWTSGGGGQLTVVDGRDHVGVSDSRILSDASPDPVRPGAQYAQTRIEIDTSALTGIGDIDWTTVALADRLGRVVDRVPGGSGPLYGTLVHAEFKASLLTDPIPNVTVEPTLGGTGIYGARDSIRPDAVLRSPTGDIRAFYDVKTGDSGIGRPRAAKFRAFSTSGVPVIELSVRRGVLLKSRR
jgi:hypothetical protein